MQIELKNAIDKYLKYLIWIQIDSIKNIDFVRVTGRNQWKIIMHNRTVNVSSKIYVKCENYHVRISASTLKLKFHFIPHSITMQMKIHCTDNDNSERQAGH